ncbi:MAG: DUF1016 family protein [Bacteroidales bacterium]|nr:DUF1016 family protein [Bacteroidales bacterium]
MNFPQLSDNIRQAHKALQNNAMRAINQSITTRNWLVGFWIVEFEQNGEDRAQYGKKLLETLAKSVNVKGLGKVTLSLCRKFYKLYPEIGDEVKKYLVKNEGVLSLNGITVFKQLLKNNEVVIFQSVTEKFEQPQQPIFQTVSEKSENDIPRISAEKIFNSLSFTHISELLEIKDPLQRSFYEIETIKGCWSVRELRRQIDTQCFIRAGLSRKPEELMEMTNQKADKVEIANIVKSPYVFEFLGIRSMDVVEESDLESMLMTHICEFILELGDGFCFEARQKRIMIDNEYFFIDLVFYHRVLKCHVLIELKTTKFNYADIAQLNMYVAYYKDKMMTENDNPPIGILLCTDASTEMVKYATAGMDENLFVSKYLLQLPDKKVFIDFLKQETAS